MSILKRLQLNGYDKFIVEEANVNSKCTSINFTLNIPLINMKAQEIDLLGNVFFVNVNEKSKGLMTVLLFKYFSCFFSRYDN